MRGLLLAGALAVVAAARGAVAQNADFSSVPLLPALAGCPPAAPGSAAPQVDAARTNMTRAQITVAAWTAPAAGRKMVMYLGRGKAAEPACAAASVGDEATCRHNFELSGSWRGLRGCAWSAPDTTRRPGYEVRNNTVYLEWQDLFPGGNRQASRYSYPVSIALPMTVNVQADVKLLEESGIKNFNLTGVSVDVTDAGRFIVADFIMHSRWPNNLTLDSTSNYVSLPGFPGSTEIVSYNLPTCVKTDGSNSTTFTTEDFCYQNGEVRINIGQQCNAGGIYVFNFKTDCFPGAASTQDCTGKVLRANAAVGTEDDSGKLVLDLCGGLYATVASVTAIMVADQPTMKELKKITVGPVQAGQDVLIGPADSIADAQLLKDGSIFGMTYMAANWPGKAFDVGAPYINNDMQHHWIVGTKDDFFKAVIVKIFVQGGQAFATIVGSAYTDAWKMEPPYSSMDALTADQMTRFWNSPNTNRNTQGSSYFLQSIPVVVQVPVAQRRLAARQALSGNSTGNSTDGYFFGDTIELRAFLNSPQLPIYESRLTFLSVYRKNLLRTPIGQASFTVRGVNTTLVSSALGPLGPNALTQLALNTNFTYFPGSDIVRMQMTPNMLPATPGLDSNELSFLTTDDFDSTSDYTFYATFRVYFDQQSSAGQRRRRLLTRDVAVPSAAVRQTAGAEASATASMVIPGGPGAQGQQPAGQAGQPGQPGQTTQAATGSPDVLAAVAVAIGAAALLASCCAVVALAVWRRRKADAGRQDTYAKLVDEAAWEKTSTKW